MVYRKLPQRLPPDQSTKVRAAILECRKSTRLAMVSVGIDTPAEHALASLVKAIDALLVYISRLRNEGWIMDSEMGDLFSRDRWHNRPGVVEEPGLFLADLRACRGVLIEAHCHVAPAGATYEALSIVQAAIDATATLLTGDATYFHGLPSGAGAGMVEREEEKRVREKGE